VQFLYLTPQNEVFLAHSKETAFYQKEYLTYADVHTKYNEYGSTDSLVKGSLVFLTPGLSRILIYGPLDTITIHF
jgi:hypothetical protein